MHRLLNASFSFSKKTACPSMYNEQVAFICDYFSTAPKLALVTRRAYRASQPVLMFGSGWT